MKQRRFLLHALAFVFMFLASASMASAMLVLEYYVYGAHALPEQPVTFTFTFKNVGDSEVIAGFTGVNMPGFLTWHTPVSAMRFAPGETKTVAMAASLGAQFPRTFEGHLVTTVSPADGTPRIIPLFLVFTKGIDATTPMPLAQQPLPSAAPGSIGKGTASFCVSGSQGSALVIQKAKIHSSGKKTTWVAGDAIDLDIEVENIGAKALDNVVVELGLRDSKGANKVRELDFNSSDKQRHTIGDLSPREEERTTFSFTVPASLDEGTYRLLLKSYVRGQELSACTESVTDFDLTAAQTIKVEREENEQRAIAFDRVTLSPPSLVCGEQAQLTVRVSNIGDEDEDRVKVALASKDLGLALTQEIASGLDEGDDTVITFTFAIPDAISAGLYALELSAESEYKNGAYQARSEIPHRIPVQVACSRSSLTPTASQQKPLTLSWTTPEEESRLSVSQSRFVLSAPQQALGIGILTVLVAIVIVALTRRPARAQNVPRRPSTTSASTGTPPRRPARPPKAPPREC